MDARADYKWMALVQGGYHFVCTAKSYNKVSGRVKADPGKRWRDSLQCSDTYLVKPSVEPEPAHTSTAGHTLKDQSLSQGLAISFSSQPRYVYDYTIQF